MLKYENIKKSYNGKVIFDIKELCFDNGQIYGIKGANGSGKSTLCKILAKVEKPDNIVVYPDIKVGYMPQSSYVFDMTVYKNMLLNADKDISVNEERIKNLLKRFDLEKYIDKNAKKLSGGEKQKLTLARLLMKNYDLLILDEPTSSLDYKFTFETEDIIKEYVKQNNNIVIMVSHEEGEIERMTKNIIYM